MATHALSFRTPLRQARLAQLLVLGWMLLEAAVAIGSGIAAHSIALTAFGADSLIELFTAGVVLRQLLRRSEHGSDAVVRDGERQASRLVGWGLYAVIAYILLSSAASLLLGVRPEGSPLGIGLTAAAVLVMAALLRWRLGVADRLRSPAPQGGAPRPAGRLLLARPTLPGPLLHQPFR